MLALLSSIAFAISEPVKADDGATLEKLRAESLASPTNYDKSLAYVRAAIAARDYEAAIVVLERLLFYNPNLPGVRFELGNLYARYGAHVMAVHYYESALASKALDEDTRIRAEAYLALSRKEIASDSLSGSLQFGYQYRTNPASLPSYYGYLPVELNKYKSGGRDSLYALGTLNYRHDFGTGRGDRFEADAQAYISRQFEFSELDFAAASLKAGPRLTVMPDADGGITLHPYGIADQSWVGQKNYAVSYGGGASIGIPLGHWLTIEPGAEWRRIDVDISSPLDSSAILNSGTLEKAYVDMCWLATDGLTISANAYLLRNRADIISGTDLSSHAFGGMISAKFEFAPPARIIPFNWSIAPFAGYSETRFDNYNGNLPPGLIYPDKRHDRTMRIGTQFMAPVTAQWSVVSTVDYRVTHSNVDNFNANGWSAMIGTMVNF